MSGRRGRVRVGSRLILAAAMTLMLSSAPAAHAQQQAGGCQAGDVAAGAFDLVVLRPLGAVALATGIVFFVASAPFVAPAGNLSETRDLFISAPFKYTFQRPLGDF